MLSTRAQCLIVVLATVVGLMVQPATAQKKKKPPRTRSSAGKLEVKKEVREAFQEAYEEDDIPLWLNFGGIDGRAFGGKKDHSDVDGRSGPWLQFDPTGATSALLAQINRLFLKENTEMPDLDDIEQDLVERLKGFDKTQDGFESAGEMLADSSEADVLLLITFVARSEELRSEDSPLFMCTLKLFDRRSKRSVWEHSFQWDGEGSDREMKHIATSITEAAMDGYANWVGERRESHRITLNVFGLTAKTKKAIRKMIPDIDGVSGKLNVKQQKRDGTRFDQFRFRYSDASDLFIEELNELCQDKLGLQFEITNAGPTTIDVKAVEYRGVPGWVLYTDDRAEGAAEARAELATLYRDANRPRVGIHVADSSQAAVQQFADSLAAPFVKAGITVEHSRGGQYDFILTCSKTGKDFVFQLRDERTGTVVNQVSWPPDRAARMNPDYPAEDDTKDEFIAGTLLASLATHLETPAVEIVIHRATSIDGVRALARGVADALDNVADTSNMTFTDSCGGFVLWYTGDFDDLERALERGENALGFKVGRFSPTLIELVTVNEGETPADIRIPEDSPCSRSTHSMTTPGRNSPAAPIEDDGPNDAPASGPGARQPAGSDPNPDNTDEPEPVVERPADDTPTEDAPTRDTPAADTPDAEKGPVTLASANDTLRNRWLDLSKNVTGAYRVGAHTAPSGGIGALSARRAAEPEFAGLLLFYKKKPGAQANRKKRGLTFDALRDAVMGEIKMVESQRSGGLAALRAPDLQEKIAEYGQDPEVSTVVPNYVLRGCDLPPTRLASMQWGLENDLNTHQSTHWGRIRERAESITPSLIGVVDQGIHVHDPRLQPVLWNNSEEVGDNDQDDDQNGLVDDVHGYNFVSKGGILDWGPTQFNHGSFCASIISAQRIDQDNDVTSIAPRGKIVTAAVLGDNGTGGTMTILHGIFYAASRGAKVINLSLGGPILPQDLERLNTHDLWKELEDNNVVLVAAAGNANQNIDKERCFPASIPRGNLITVMAIDPEGKPARAWNGREWEQYSNYGAQDVDIAAPGTMILGIPSENETTISDGTSFAAPMVTATVALVQGLHPDWDYETVVRAILETATPSDELKGYCKTGGVLNIEAALDWTP